MRGRVPPKTGNPIGMADVVSCCRGKWYEFEVKIGSDKQSEKQRQHEIDIKLAGGKYFIINSVDYYLHIANREGLND